MRCGSLIATIHQLKIDQDKITFKAQYINISDRSQEVLALIRGSLRLPSQSTTSKD